MPATPDRVTQLEAEVAAMRAQLARLTDARSPRRRVPIRRVLALGLALLLAIPGGVVLAAHQFSDVPTSHQFHNSIDAIADAGITTGCGGGRYCPEGLVTRGQMAAFLNRLGALTPGSAPKVNSLRLNGHRAVTGIAAFTATRTRVLRDPVTGADVFVGVSPRVEITNTHATRTLAVFGISSRGAGTIEHETATLLPGETATFNTETLQSGYLDLLLTLAGSTAAQTRFSHLTCSMIDVGGGLPAYQSCMVIGRG